MASLLCIWLSEGLLKWSETSSNAPSHVSHHSFLLVLLEGQHYSHRSLELPDQLPGCEARGMGVVDPKISTCHSRWSFICNLNSPWCLGDRCGDHCSSTLLPLIIKMNAVINGSNAFFHFMQIQSSCIYMVKGAHQPGAPMLLLNPLIQLSLWPRCSDLERFKKKC